MKITIILASLFLLCAPLSFAADSDPQSKDESENPVSSTKALDGVNIEAVENYPNSQNHELGFGLGFYPFKPYYYAFSFNGSYIYAFNKTIAWEILNVGYALTSNTNLSTQLADLNKVTPTTIERLSAIFSSNLLYTHTHGKMLFLDKYIHYFRSSVILGAGMIMTNQRSQASGNLGVRLDAYVSDSFSWKVEVRDMITINGLENFVAVNLGTGIDF